MQNGPQGDLFGASWEFGQCHQCEVGVVTHFQRAALKMQRLCRVRGDGLDEFECELLQRCFVVEHQRGPELIEDTERIVGA